MWMWVVGAILLLLVLLAFLPLGVRLVYEDDFFLYAYLWRIRVRLLPRRKKAERIRSHTQRARARKERREERRKQRLAKKEKRQQKPEALKKEVVKKRRTLSQTSDFVREIGTFVLELLLKISGYAKLVIARLIIIIGTGDAAETAKLYGIARIAVSGVLGALDEFVTLKTTEREIVVDVDFLAESSTICCDISLQLRVWQVLALGVKGLLGFLRFKLSSSQKRAS